MGRYGCRAWTVGVMGGVGGGEQQLENRRRNQRNNNVMLRTSMPRFVLVCLWIPAEWMNAGYRDVHAPGLRNRRYGMHAWLLIATTRGRVVGSYRRRKRACNVVQSGLVTGRDRNARSAIFNDATICFLSPDFPPLSFLADGRDTAGGELNAEPGRVNTRFRTRSCRIYLIDETPNGNCVWSNDLLLFPLVMGTSILRRYKLSPRPSVERRPFLNEWSGSSGWIFDRDRWLGVCGTGFDGFVVDLFLNVPRVGYIEG